jgi:hypothetical protein
MMRLGHRRRAWVRQEGGEAAFAVSLVAKTRNTIPSR